MKSHNLLPILLFILVPFILLFPSAANGQQPIEKPFPTQKQDKKKEELNKEPRLPGSWAGWIYLQGSENLPFRIHFTTVGESIRSVMDFPSFSRYGLPVHSLSVSGDKIKIRGNGPLGNLLLIHGRYLGDLITGRFLVRGKAHGQFHLHRSPLPIAGTEPSSYAHLAGSYRLPDQRILVISPNAWGELTVLDSAGGRFAVLFASRENHFFIGSAMYVPGPLVSQVRFNVVDEAKNTSKNSNKKGPPQKSAISLVWHEEGKEPLTGMRIPLTEEKLSVSCSGAKLSGTLVKPAGDGPFPAVVVIGRQPYHPRRLYRYDAHMYAASGVAAFIYDQRGYGDSSGRKSVPLSRSAEDVNQILRTLSARPDIRSDRVGLSALGRGGWIAPLAVSKSQDAAFLVLSVAPAMSPYRLKTSLALAKLGDINTRERHGRRRSEADMAGYLAEMIKQRLPAGAVFDKTNPLAGLWPPNSSRHTKEDPKEREKWEKLNLHYDPLPALKRVTIPVMALFAQHDAVVVPDQNLPVMKAAFKKAKNRDYTLKLIPGVDHDLRPLSEKGKEHVHLQVGFAPLHWSIVLSWLQAHVK